MGKMQQDVAIFHGGWTTVNDATAIYGSYRKSCNKVPCTLHSCAEYPYISTQYFRSFKDAFHLSVLHQH